ncbi:transcription accessory protein [Corynebacterium atypicum]|uniref:Transcription accessory protein n=1 Tax=Corynebacterium atypicum TaxID=191610 RepID=A0ABM5QMD7_9CORY|nr:transcription accessory protein [Corynebacterium atypicum]
MNSAAPSFSLAQRIAEELGVKPSQVQAAMDLLAAGNTVPFIARYRKELTGGLDDTALRTLESRSTYLKELEERKSVVLEAIEEQGKLTASLRALIAACDTKARLEDLYRPFKKRRETKADKARKAGLEPLLDAVLEDPDADPEALASGMLSATSVDTTSEALTGARDILVDRLALDAELSGWLREEFFARGEMSATVVEGKEEEGKKYRDFFAFNEPLDKLPAHRVLALFRGEKEGVLRLHLDGGDESFFTGGIAVKMDIPTQRSAWLANAVGFGWRTKLAVSAGLDARNRLREQAEKDSLEIFAKNLRDVLLAAPAGQRSVLGLDPGFRNGVKCAVVDKTGKVLDTTIVYPHPPQNQWQAARDQLAGLAAQHGVELIAVGNGTASRESDKLAGEVADLIEKAGGARPTPVVVSEAGASVYSASEIAAAEFPEMDVALRGAVSIARRLQDPLAELVKVDPKSIGVGQYQHDVNQAQLSRTLDSVVEDAVNAVGVDLNTASVPLLERVAGVSHTLAKNIVAYRDQNGSFATRKELSKVPRLGPKAFEQCAGFLRINGGTDPLDASAVHPEAYPVVRAITRRTGLEVPQLIGAHDQLKALDPAEFATAEFGVPTVTDIIAELDKPGRDPRPEFRTAQFAEGVEKLSDLKEGMILEGTVTNVAAFGAFVDVGVHQDGLVHVSQLADRFVADPHEVVSSGQVVKVRVLEVDEERQRISLSLKLRGEGRDAKKAGGRRGGDRERGGKNRAGGHRNKRGGAAG